MSTTTRQMREADLGPVSKLAAGLLRLQHEFDPRRFFLPDDPEDGYRWWLEQQLEVATNVLIVAEVDGEVAGYFYGAIGERDWMLLLDAHGAVHDVYVDERFRRQGVASALMKAGIAALEAKGAKQLVLSSATPNTQAQALFEKLGFRRTSVEMTRG